MTAPASAAPLRLPDTMIRQDVGPYARSLREHYGLSQQDISARLHIRLKYVQAIELSQFDQLPGKVYAKGYVHTYAEFLGLDATQVVEKCFGEEPTREAQEHFIPANARESVHIPKKWLGFALMGVVLVGLYGVMTNAPERAEAVALSEQASAVPEAMLAPMRRAVMPTPRNINCLRGKGNLSCFYAARLTTRWVMPAPPPSYALVAVGNSIPSKAKKKK